MHVEDLRQMQRMWDGLTLEERDAVTQWHVYFDLGGPQPPVDPMVYIESPHEHAGIGYTPGYRRVRLSSEDAARRFVRWKNATDEDAPTRAKRASLKFYLKNQERLK